jgi:purine-binding chemotaxis protein CheW
MAHSNLPDVDQEQLLVTFYGGESAYGMDAFSVQEVVLVGAITPVHHAPQEVRGIINLRGKIITVIDLNEKLRGIATQLSEDSRILITDWSSEYVGLLVDRVGEVLNLVSEQIEACPANLQESQRRYIEGVYRNENGTVAILNLERVLA